MTISKIINIAILIIAIIGLCLCIHNNFDISVHKGTETALEAYINFSSISLGFLGTIISMVTVLSKQDFLKSVLAKQEAKKDFIMLGALSVVCGLISIILSVSLTFIIGNTSTGTIYSFWVSNILWISILFYFINFIMFLIINLFSIFSEV